MPIDSHTHTDFHIKAVTDVWGKILNLDCKRKTTRSDVIITKLYSGEKRNKWQHGFVTMISLRTMGNCVTIVMHFSCGLKCRIMRQTGGDAFLEQRLIDGSGEDLVGEEGRWDQRLPCYPLAAFFTYIKGRGLVSQCNRKGGVNTHLQGKTRSVRNWSFKGSLLISFMQNEQV